MDSGYPVYSYSGLIILYTYPHTPQCLLAGLRCTRRTGRSLIKMKILNTLRHKPTLRVCVIPEYNLCIRRDGVVAPIKIPITFMELFEKTPHEDT